MDFVKLFNSLSLIEIYAYVISACAVAFFGSYLKEKAKLKASQENARALEQEKQAVIAEYNQELEDYKFNLSEDVERLRQMHALDFQKRKYKYEMKAKEYSEFMNVLDSFHGVVIKVIAEDLVGIMKAYYAADFVGSNKATIDFNDKAMDAINGVRNQEAVLFSQLNGLKLTASEEVLDLLAKLRASISESRVYLEGYIHYICGSEFRFNPVIPPQLNAGSDMMLKKILDNRAALQSALRTDLDLM